MKFLNKALLALAVGVAAIGGYAWAQAGMVHLTTFGAQTNITGIGYPCVTTCYITATQGTFVANGATPVTVANALVTANSTIVPTLKTVGGTVSPSMCNVQTITAGTGFTISCTASDTSTYNYLVLN